MGFDFDDIFFNGLKNQLNRIESKLDSLINKENKMSATLDQVLADVTSETTLENSIVTLLDSVQAQLTSALANTTIAPADQAKIDSIFTGLEANKTALTAAIAANTPAAPVTPVEPGAGASVTGSAS